MTEQKFTLAEVVAFLCGEAQLDGVWFGEPHPTEKGAFWWRKHLRAAAGVGVDGDPRVKLLSEGVDALRDSLIEPATRALGTPMNDWREAGLVCQACAGDAPAGKCLRPQCVGGPIVRELVPAGVKGEDRG